MNSMTVSVIYMYNYYYYDVLWPLPFYLVIAGYPLTDDLNVKTQFDPLMNITESELRNVVCELPPLCSCNTVLELMSSKRTISS